MKYLLLVNINSRRYKKILRKSAKIRKIFYANGHTLEAVYSSTIEDSSDALKRAVIEKFDVVILGGGDGAVNLGVNLLAGTDVKLALIPTGTVNVFAKEVKLPLISVSRAVKVILRNHSCRFDLGLINGKKYFLVMAGAGIDGYAVKMKDRYYKNIIGRFSYLIAAARYFFSHKPSIIVRIPDKNINEKCGSVIIGNMHKYGGRFSVTSLANPTDGILDILLLKGTMPLDFLKYFVGVIFGKHLYFNDVSYYQAEKFILETEGKYPAYYQTDGDPAGELPIEVTVEPLKIEIVVPRKYM
ncbi:MAG: diacylglycerol kinase family lipid kinase, partial [Actinomycetia bacterium]|nr:diacylglycerol kinase family lipid kinase [Actinomycetes bacterium]